MAHLCCHLGGVFFNLCHSRCHIGLKQIRGGLCFGLYGVLTADFKSRRTWTCSASCFARPAGSFAGLGQFLFNGLFRKGRRISRCIPMASASACCSFLPSEELGGLPGCLLPALALVVTVAARLIVNRLVRPALCQSAAAALWASR